MCKLIKCVVVVLLLAFATYAFVDKRHAEVIAVKTAEGSIAGLLFGLVVAADRWFNAHPQAAFTAWRFRRVVAREFRVGLCSGFLIGVLFAVVALLNR
jgi:hypothetical protein